MPVADGLSVTEAPRLWRVGCTPAPIKARMGSIAMYVSSGLGRSVGLVEPRPLPTSERGQGGAMKQKIAGGAPFARAE